MENITLFDSPIKVLGGSILLVEGILAAILTTQNLTDRQSSWIIIGMISALLLTIISAVMIHWIDNKQKTATIDTSDKQYEYDIFISFPIAGIKNPKERSAVNDFANKLESQLKKIGFSKIFNASLHFSNNHTHQPPKIAAKTDFNALDKSKNLLFLYPSETATSALIELGYALARKKKITMCAKNDHTLPFLARGFSEAFRNVSYLEYKNEDHLINMLSEHNDDYFIK